MSLNGGHVTGQSGHVDDHNLIDAKLTTHDAEIAALQAAPGGVSSVNGRQGAVTLAKSDVTATGLSYSDVGAPSAATVELLKAYQFRPETYGAVGDDATDDSAAIRSAVAAAVAFAQTHTAYAEVVFDPSKSYFAGGSLQQGGTTKGNALIPLPMIAETAKKITLVFRGSRAGDSLWHWNQTTAQKGTGAVIRTTVVGSNDATYGEASVLGGPTPEQGFPASGGSQFTNLCVVVDGVTIVVPDDPHISGFDFRGCAEARVPLAACMTAATPGTRTAATQAWQFGLAMPANNNNALADIGYYSAEGLNYGVMTSEHTVAESIRAIYCVAGIEHGGNHSSGDGATAHGAIIKYACVEACQVGLGFVNGAYPSKIDIGCFDTENNSFKDINDPSNVGIGTIGFTGIGANVLPTVSGGSNLRIIGLHQQTGSAGAVTVPATTVAKQNTFYRDAGVTVTAGAGSTCVVTVDSQALCTIPASGIATVLVPSGKNVVLTYTSAPTWKWTLL